MVSVRDNWDRTERTVGGTAPDLSDDEILAIATDICEYTTGNSVLAAKQVGPRMEAYSEIAVIISEALGIPYDPALLDAGSDSEIDARNVVAFKMLTSKEGLCPAIEGLDVFLFFSPWTAKASAQDG